MVPVTHSVLALDVCDDVMVMAPGGRIAYFGPPSGVLAHFGCSYPEVFDLLDDPNLRERIPAPAPLAATTGALPPARGGHSRRLAGRWAVSCRPWSSATQPSSCRTGCCSACCSCCRWFSAG